MDELEEHRLDTFKFNDQLMSFPPFVDLINTLLKYSKELKANRTKVPSTRE